jgi:hypothetical protein
MDGGATALDNPVLLCRRHHTLLHGNGFMVERSDDGNTVFKRPNGRVIDVSPALVWSGRASCRPESGHARFESGTEPR